MIGSCQHGHLALGGILSLMDEQAGREICMHGSCMFMSGHGKWGLRSHLYHERWQSYIAGGLRKRPPEVQLHNQKYFTSVYLHSSRRMTTRYCTRPRWIFLILEEFGGTVLEERTEEYLAFLMVEMTLER